jgi:hypothetical protein
MDPDEKRDHKNQRDPKDPSDQSNPSKDKGPPESSILLGIPVVLVHPGRVCAIVALGSLGPVQTASCRPVFRPAPGRHLANCRPPSKVLD